MNDHLTGIRNGLDWATVRRWKRYHVDVRLKVSYKKDGKVTVAFGQGSDVSEGGMAGYIPIEQTKGDYIDIEMTLPYSPTPIKVKAAIRNRNGFRYGLEYIQIENADREALLRSLKALALVT